MRDKALCAIAQNRMISWGDRITAGVSGGADSVALLDFLASAREGLGFRLYACHVNHRLRGEESDRDEAFVRELCRSLGVALIVKSVDVAAFARGTGLSVELAARELRYTALRQAAREHAGDPAGDGGGLKIALAHTLSDSLETALLNIARGTGLKGLCGIPPVRDEIIRPLITCTRGEIESHLAQRGLGYVVDSTNLEDGCGRNRIRHQAVPALISLNPSLESVFAREAKSFSEDEDCLCGLAEAALSGAKELSGLRIDRLRPLHRAVLLRALRAWLLEAGLSYDAKRLELVLNLVKSGSGSVEIEGGRFASARGEYLTLHQAPPDKGAAAPVDERDAELPEPGKRALFSLSNGKTLTISVFTREELKKTRKCNSLDLTNLADYDKITKIVILRAKRDGDRFHPARGGGGKSLKKLFNERKIPPADRPGLVLACAGEDIVWIERCGASMGAAADGRTERFVLFRMGDEKAGDIFPSGENNESDGT